jgi:hypothetical protein
MLTRNKVILKQPYLTKKIEPSALKTVLGSNHQTAYRLYCITNGLRERQDFLTLKDSNYDLRAFVKTEASVAAGAKEQVWSIKHLQPILNKKPKYILRCSLVDRRTNKEVYRCDDTTLNKNSIYALIEECETDIKNILHAATLSSL